MEPHRLMSQVTELSLNGVMGGIHSFVAKEPPAIVIGAICGTLSTSPLVKGTLTTSPLVEGTLSVSPLIEGTFESGKC